MAREFALSDKYTLERGQVFMTGIQALVRLPMLQRQRDQAAGLNTAGFISGYRGSPLGGLDQELVRAKPYLDPHHIVFSPGLNEDLGATAVWGTQQLGLYPSPRYDGVFAMWYGKGPGVDRSGDVLRHGNAAGSSRLGGVLLIAGDDHAAKSSSLPHQTDHVFDALLIPVLSPAGVQEFLDLGIHGWAMSRYSGCWVAMKAISDTVESSAIVEVDPQRVSVRLPDSSEFAMPPEGLNIRWPDPPLIIEERLLHQKLYAVQAYARANRLDRIVVDSPQARLGIITAGKSYLDVMQALDDLGIDESMAASIGLRIYKVALTWPLEPEGAHQFALGLEEILVVEEKRQVLEYQLKEQLYNWQEDVRPRVIGKFDEKGEWVLPAGQWLLPAAGELTPAMIARVIAARIARFHVSETINARLQFFADKENALRQPRDILQRPPYYCSGCPHNSSTRLPEGSLAMAGIGCHYMAIWIQPGTRMFSQMGGEGVAWAGIQPFSDTRHVFVNLGDGTYFHSGILAIRAAVSARLNITYKLLYNDAVAMTGGQSVDGTLSVPILTQQLAAEGVTKIVITSDEPEKYDLVNDLAAGVTVHHRDDLDRLQRELRDVPGVTVLIHDQTCAAEKRRRRKRGKMIDPPRRVVINERVCEGCGDCSKQSNCLSVVPVDTEYGRKRRIDQSSCNKDFSCLKGFCPSLVTLEGDVRPRRATMQKTGVALNQLPPLPDATLPPLDQPWGVLVTGVGGTGVVTIGGVLGVAAQIAGLGVTVLDQTGLAQKGGAVTTHLRFAARQSQLHAVRIAAGDANLILGCDLVVSASNDCLAKMRKGFTRAVINSHQAPTGDFARQPDMHFPAAAMTDAVRRAVGDEHLELVDATELVTALLGDTIATNMFMLGYAWQKGLIPLPYSAIEQAIRHNATAVEMNTQAFNWGRHAAHDPLAVQQIALPPVAPPPTLPEFVARRCKDLSDYQDVALAQRYQVMVERVHAAEQHAVAGSEQLAWAVARSYYHVLAYKDEYEVARLFSDGVFKAQLAEQFEGDYQLNFHLGPSWLQWLAEAGQSRKFQLGGWMQWAFRRLASLKHLRGGRLDPFRYSADRQLERRLIGEYESCINSLLDGLSSTDPSHSAERLRLAAEIAGLAQQIRGYGPVKQASYEQVRRDWNARLHAYQTLVHPSALPRGAGLRL